MDKKTFLSTPISPEFMVSSQLFARNRADFASHASGNGMIRAGISDGDTLLFKKVNNLENGEIGVFVINKKDIAVKRYFRSKDTVVLAYDDGIQSPYILNANDVEIIGKLEYIIKDVKGSQS
jgi:repressor LexA